MFELPDEGKTALDLILKCQASAERRHKNYRSKWQRLYALYRGYNEFRSQYRAAGPNDRDNVIREAQGTWGAELHIPYSFEVVEQVMTRIAADMPTQPLGPRGDTSPENVERMRTLVELQQKQVRYDLRLSDTGKSGLIYGLGVQKGPFWRTETRESTALRRGTVAPWVEAPITRTIHDDPDVEDVDIFDFFWDPFASSLGSGCRWALHRMWRSTDFCVKALVSKAWNNPFAVPPSEVQFMSHDGQYDKFHKERWQAAGQEDLTTVQDDQMHEVWEYHDGKQLVLVLDRKFPVHVGPNPSWHGELPFHAFRPSTSGIKELPGIGEIEPIEDLQIEIDTLRSQRRDNATLVLQRSFAYADGFVDPDVLKFGPGSAIPVNGDPRELLFPIPVQDIPGSSYQEEANLIADIERVTGLRDQGSQASETATGAQIVQQAGSARIQNKAKRLHAEVVAPQTNQWILLNQQHIVESRQLTVPASEAEPGVRGAKWSKIKLGPAELAGDMYALPVDDGSTMPDNPTQMRQDGLQLWQMFAGNPDLDQRELAKRSLGLMGVKQPDILMAPAQRVPPVLMDLLIQSGAVPEETLRELYEQAEQMEQQEKNQAQGDQPSAEPEAA